ncbi:hypothetical protein [Mastigocoleus testarum]|uniref:Uncharacterized protein n=1 Tax=Mastigocoleus testarum BC008 TaxID=371196 RepID=A0A0V7ZLL5_9CYAN|nr:hypothetical protein [Mastigocoleus testarum]KST65174.1 hypothetical protein BC008_20475 [Mastigocoleus testarum BC008]
MLETIHRNSSPSSSLSPSRSSGRSSGRSSNLSNFVTTLLATTLLSVSFLSVNPLQTNNSLTESFTSQSFDSDVSQIITQTNSGNPNSLGNLSRILTIGLVGAGSAGLIWRINKGNKSLNANINSSNYGSWIDRASPPLRKRLLKLLYNDRRTANRLIAGANITNPGRSVNWLTEKVIYELERDRR